MIEKDFGLRCIAEYVAAVDRRDPGITDDDVEKVRRFRESLKRLNEAAG